MAIMLMMESVIAIQTTTHTSFSLFFRCLIPNEKPTHTICHAYSSHINCKHFFPLSSLFFLYFLFSISELVSPFFFIFAFAHFPCSFVIEEWSHNQKFKCKSCELAVVEFVYICVCEHKICFY